MKNLLITNWKDIDTNDFYRTQLKDHPLVFSEEHQLWLAHSYSICKALFLSTDALIPAPLLPESDHTHHSILLLISKLARLNNGTTHQEARFAAMLIYEKINKINVFELVEKLVSANCYLSEFDSVTSISKKLPVMLIGYGLGFSEYETAWIIENMHVLVKIMSPNKTMEDLSAIGQLIDRFFNIAAGQSQIDQLAEQLVLSHPGLSKEEALTLLTCNLLGLLIQSYDAGRGLLTNSILQLAKLREKNISQQINIAHLKKIIIEVLRIDPPIHSTKRIAAADIYLDGQIIKKGQRIMIIMAAANLDEQVFINAYQFDELRNNNDMNLSFGLGGHACIAKYIIIEMVAQACACLYSYNFTIPDQQMEFESQQNARLIKNLFIKIYKNNV